VTGCTSDTAHPLDRNITTQFSTAT
jgi:hypothetical protein